MLLLSPTSGDPVQRMDELEEQHQSPHTRAPADSERRLLWAVLLDAVHCYRHNRPSSASVRMRRAWHRECQWFQSNDRSSPFTFESICDALGLDPDYVRRLVRSSDERWRARLQRKPRTE